MVFITEVASRAFVLMTSCSVSEFAVQTVRACCRKSCMHSLAEYSSRAEEVDN
jgi:hypothetical protein